MTDPDTPVSARTYRPAKVRFYVDADVLGLAKVLAQLRPDVTYPGDPGVAQATTAAVSGDVGGGAGPDLDSRGHEAWVVDHHP